MTFKNLRVGDNFMFVANVRMKKEQQAFVYIKILLPANYKMVGDTHTVVKSDYSAVRLGCGTLVSIDDDAKVRKVCPVNFPLSPS